MNKRIQPLSEEFLYCSPEFLEKELFRLMVPGATEKPKEKTESDSKEKPHVQPNRH